MGKDAEQEQRPACVKCGYDVSGIAPGGVCPECGVPVPGSRCFGCGYSLSGLDIEGVCPECGMAVRASQRHGELGRSAPGYVRTLKRGAMWCHISILASVALLIVVIGVSFGIGLHVSSASFGVSPRTAELLVTVGLSLAWLASGVFCFWAWWMFTAPDPHRESPVGDAARRTARGSAIGYLCVLVASVPVSVITPLEYGVDPMTGEVVEATLLETVGFALSALLNFLGLAAFVTLFFGTIFYMRGLGQRMAAPDLVKQAKRWAWMIPVVSVVALPLCGIGPLIGLVLFYNFFVTMRKALAEVIPTAERLAAEALGAGQSEGSATDAAMG